MKQRSKILALVLGMAVLASAWPSHCQATSYEEKTGDIAADVLIYRPAGLILMIGGAVLFTLALPVSAITGDVKKTGNTLVKTPFEFTFHRRMGTDLRKYTEDYEAYPDWKPYR